jgi:hypothetical protein
VVLPREHLGHQLARLAVALGDVRELEPEAVGELAQELLVSGLALGNQGFPERLLGTCAVPDLLQCLGADQAFDRRAEPFVLETAYETPPVRAGTRIIAR